jgi:hypothetical protein
MKAQAGNVASRWNWRFGLEDSSSPIVLRASVRDTAILRDALPRSEYWPRAVSELFSALDKPVKPLPIPVGGWAEQLRRALTFAQSDPAVSVAISTDVLERALQHAAVTRGIAKAGLRPEQYLALLSTKGLLKMPNSDFVKELVVSWQC